MTNQSRQHVCPFEVALEVAKELVDENRDIIRYPSRNLGGIALRQKLLAEVRQRHECHNSEISSSGQFVCPLQDIVNSAQSMATGPWSENSFTLDLNSFDQPSSVANNPRSTGQYL